MSAKKITKKVAIKSIVSTVKNGKHGVKVLPAKNIDVVVKAIAKSKAKTKKERKSILKDAMDKRLVLKKAIDESKTQDGSQRYKALKAISAAGKKGLSVATFVEKNPPYLVRYLTGHGLVTIH